MVIETSGRGERAYDIYSRLLKERIIFLKPRHSEIKEAIENNIPFLRAIDSKSGKKIQLEDIRKYKIYGLVGKETSRNMAYLMFKKPLPIKDQKLLIELFNKELEEVFDLLS